jgi:tetratricopeptide (TPR) repeat protein
MRQQFLCVVLGLAAAFIMPATPALADDAEVCASSEPDQAILACTRLISNNEVSEADRGTAYVNRANAYANKGDYDRAIADATRAIELGAN